MKVQIYKPMSLHELGQRDNQEDNIIPRKGESSIDDRVFVLCDGMGGCDYGEVASKIVCETVANHLNNILLTSRNLKDEDIYQALNEAYLLLDKALAEHPDANSMGTTLAIVALHDAGAIVAHIGDSRIYHVRPETQELLYRSKDHSWVQQMYELGELKYEEMKTSRHKNVILKAVMPGEEKRTTPDIVHIANIRKGDYFFMCTDGILENIDDEDINAIIFDDLLDDKAKIDIFEKKTANNQDNHSAHLIHITNVLNEPGDEKALDDEAEARAANKALNDPIRLMAAITHSCLATDDTNDVSIAEVPEEDNDPDSENLNIVESFSIDDETSSTPDVPSEKPKRNTVSILLSIITILIGLIVAGAVFFLQTNNNAQPEPIQNTPQSQNSKDDLPSKPQHAGQHVTPTKPSQQPQQPQNQALQQSQQSHPDKPATQQDKLDEVYEQVISHAQQITKPTKPQNDNQQTSGTHNTSEKLNDLIQVQSESQTEK